MTWAETDQDSQRSVRGMSERYWGLTGNR